MLLSAAVRYFTTMLDAVASNWLRRDAFANLMRLGPAYFHRHDAGELTMVINQVCLTAEIGLRQLLVDPLIQAFSAVSIGYALYSLLADAQAAGQGNHTLLLVCMVVAVAALFLWLVKMRGSPIAARRQRFAAAIPGAFRRSSAGHSARRRKSSPWARRTVSPKNTTPISTSTWPANGATPSPWNP